MQTVSVWQATRTFFPLFLSELTKAGSRSVCVVGASDGKFVIPLAASGYHVVAVERNAVALDGGAVELPSGAHGRMQGLRRRLEVEGLGHRVEIIEGDLLDLRLTPGCDAVWTSCSWHYSVNHRRPLGEFVQAMQSLCKAPALFGAEFMMPVEPWHHDVEHYLEEGEIRRYLTDWRIRWETYTPSFVELPHVEQLEPHVHRMGFVVAERPMIGDPGPSSGRWTARR